MVAIAGLASAVEVQSSVELPLRVDISATATDCENNPGPWITLSGVIALGDMVVELVFRNNMKGTHERTETTTVSAQLDLADDQIQIPKQPVRGGTGGNPFIWIQFTDADGNPISEEIFLGRCVQGLNADISESFSIPAVASLFAEGDNCENSPGPFIYLSGEIALSGVNALIIFRNNDNKVGGPHEAVVETSAQIQVVPDGMTLVIPKQPVLGGVGGNPHVWIRMGGEEIYLGRCNQDL